MTPRRRARSRVKRIAVTGSSGFMTIAIFWGRSFSSTKRVRPSRARLLLAPGLTWNSSRKNANTRVPGWRAARSSSLLAVNRCHIGRAGAGKGAELDGADWSGRPALEELEIRRTQIQDHWPAVGVGHDGVDPD